MKSMNRNNWAHKMNGRQAVSRSLSISQRQRVQKKRLGGHPQNKILLWSVYCYLELLFKFKNYISIEVLHETVRCAQSNSIQKACNKEPNSLG